MKKDLQDTQTQVHTLADFDTASDAISLGQSDSTQDTKKQSECVADAKVGDYFDLLGETNSNTGLEFKQLNFDQNRFEDARFSFVMPRAQSSLPHADLGQDLSEPIVPTKNIFFPIAPLSKILSTNDQNDQDDIDQ